MRSIEINNKKERNEAYKLQDKYYCLHANLGAKAFPRALTATISAFLGLVDLVNLGVNFVLGEESALPVGIISCIVCFGISSGIGLDQLMRYLQFKEVDNEITRRSMIAHKKLLSVEKKNNDEEKQFLQ